MRVPTNPVPGRKHKVAILDMYEGTRNLGMQNLLELLEGFPEDLEVAVFDVRSHFDLPDLDHDIYIFSGGPGSPLVGDDRWWQPFHRLIDRLWAHNLQPGQARKFCFFICHSFQMACRHFGIGRIVRRRKKSFGTFPVFKTPEGDGEWLFQELDNPFWVADFREYQVIDPQPGRLEELGAQLLLIERERDRPELKRAMMAVRFSPEMVGTQFHPEADPIGMRSYFLEPDRIQAVLTEFGEDRYHAMVDDLKDPAKIARTHRTILPFFLFGALGNLRAEAS